MGEFKFFSSNFHENQILRVESGGKYFQEVFIASNVTLTADHSTFQTVVKNPQI